MNEDEQQIEDFLTKAQSPPEEERELSEEERVTEHARRGDGLVPTTLQKQTDLTEQEWRSKIDDIAQRAGDRIDKQKLLDQAAQLATPGGTLTEAQLDQLVNDLIEPAQPQTPPATLRIAGLDGLQNTVSGLADRASALATPGGIGFLVAVLLFFVWAIVPVSGGKTRLRLLFDVLTGRTQIRNTGATFTPAAAQTGQPVTSFSGGGMIDYIPPFDEY